MECLSLCTSTTNKTSWGVTCIKGHDVTSSFTVYWRCCLEPVVTPSCRQHWHYDETHLKRNASAERLEEISVNAFRKLSPASEVHQTDNLPALVSLSTITLTSPPKPKRFEKPVDFAE